MWHCNPGRTVAILLALSLFCFGEDGDTSKPFDLAKEAQTFLETYHREGGFQGSALIYQQGKVVYENSFGMANADWQIPNKADTRFEVASVAKTFTAVMILLSVEDGLIGLDDTIDRYLPELKPEMARKITIRHLLTHRSGITRVAAEYMLDPSDHHIGMAQVAEALNAAPLLFEPGAKKSYSNSGYFLLAELVARVQKKPFQEALQHRVLNPLSMKDTGFITPNAVIPNLATRYQTGLITELMKADAMNRRSSAALGGGNLYSTPRDMLRLVEAFRDGRMLSESSRALMFATPDSIAWDNYPISDGGGRLFATHGAGNGCLAVFGWLPKQNAMFCYMTNSDGLGRGGFFDVLSGLATLTLNELPESKIPARPTADVLNLLWTKGEAAALALMRTMKLDESLKLNANDMQATGAPDSGPGESHVAWASNKPNAGAEWLDLTYAETVQATRVDVYETQNPGAIRQVGVFDTKGHETLVPAEAQTRRLSDKGVTITQIILPGQSGTRRIKLYLDTASVRGWSQIDAVGLMTPDAKTHWADQAKASTNAEDGGIATPQDKPTKRALLKVADAYRQVGRFAEARKITSLVAAAF